MSRSSIKTYDFHFTDAFINFLQLVETATVTYKKERIEVDNEATFSSEIRFNLSSSVEKFKGSLSHCFSNACEEIIEELRDTYQKTEKLFILARYLVEVATLQSLLQYNNGRYRHERFSFNNLSKTEFSTDVMGQEDFHEYFAVMDLYLKKFSMFFQSIKQTIEITPQQDFPTPQKMLPDPNASNLENPILFFEFVLAKNGITVLRNAFMPTEEDEYYIDVYYDKQTETKTIRDQDQETGEEEVTVYKFIDALYTKCHREFNITKALIDQRIIKAVSRSEIELYIEVLISRVKYLNDNFERFKEAQKYPLLQNFPQALIRFICKKYRTFCPSFEHDPFINNLLSTDKQQTLDEPEVKKLPQANNPGVFKWAKGEPSRLTAILYSYINKELIADTPTEIFLRAFSGEPIEKPLGIQWIDKPKNGTDVNKVTLLYLFKCLNEKGLLDIDFNSPSLLQKLEFVFADADGKRLDYWEQSKANLKKAKGTTYAKSLIDRAIAAMVS